jgi:thioredoxin-related protein
MKTTLLALSLALGTCAFAAKPGDTYDQVIAEKGKPVSQIDAGSSKVLNYADASIRLKENTVVEVKPVAATPSPAARSENKPAPKPAPTPRPAPRARIVEAEWTTDYQAAITKAQAEKRNVFLFFTGSDWCGWCMRLDQEILATAEFKSYANDKLVLVKLDFPRKVAQSDELRAQNQSLATRFRIKGYPTVIILNPAGKAVKTLGYQEGGPQPFIEALRSVEP